MNFMTGIQLPTMQPPVKYGDQLLLVGSCFTEHIGNALQEHKFNVLQNPHGILFDTASVYHAIESYIENKKYTVDDLFYLNELWQSWHHHSRFSGIDKDAVLEHINNTQEQAHQFLKNADWVIITLGSSFSYRLTSENPDQQKLSLKVANCHRAPGQWFDKKMLTVEENVSLLDNLYHRLRNFNKKIKLIFTISPVRHLRDGVVDNNRSKARLIEAVHHIVHKFDHTHYFPAYELVIDVLRDYRFYDIDFAHPNYQATEFVLEKFAESSIAPDSRAIMKEVKQLAVARRHKPLQPATHAHQQFLKIQLNKAIELKGKYPFLDLAEEVAYFSGESGV